MIRKWFSNTERKNGSRMMWFIGGTLGLIENAAIIVITILLVWAFQSKKMPALEIWHTTPLTTEFIAADATAQMTLQDYIGQEDRLYNELKTKIYDRVKPEAKLAFSRYLANGVQNPLNLPQNWNRTFELVPENIQGGALLMHGLSDSPYSLRRIGELFHARGFYVLGLRLPGHGTIPGALTEVNWEDWLAASRIAARHVRERIGPDKPFVISGYSNGGAVSVKYSLDALTDSTMPQADQLILFSPEIGITPFSAIANAHKLFSFIPYFEQSKWLSIQPEYDPFKYNSFPKNAGQQGHEITSAIQNQLKKKRKSRELSGFPPVLTFLSWVDSTVKTSKTIDSFYDLLENQGNELVIFDVNRSDEATPFYPTGDAAKLDGIRNRSDLSYQLTIIGNASSDSQDVVQHTKAPHSPEFDISPLGIAWPPDIYSLSHVAVPFSHDDPVYGAAKVSSGVYNGIPIGSIQPRGETQYLTVPLSQLIRLRYNPFFSYIEGRINEEIDNLFK